MTDRGPTVSGICAAVLLVSSLSGCAYRWVLSEPSSGEPSAPTEPADRDPELSALGAARRQLEERLARVEGELAELPTAKGGRHFRRDELLAERLSIILALIELDQAIDSRRAELFAGAAGSSSTTPATRSQPDPAKLVRRAEERIAAHRRAQRRGDRNEVVAGQGILGILGGAGPGAGAAKGARTTSGAKGRTVFDFDQDAEGDDTTGKAADLDDLLNALPPKRKQVAGSRGTRGESEKKEEKRQIWRDDKPDEDDRADVKAAVVAAAGPPPDLRPAVRRHRAQLADCLPQELRAGGQRITVRARIAVSGRLRAPQVSGVPALSPDVAACLADVIQQIQAPPQDDSRSVQFSLSFQGS